jgi:hypothetical protein
MKTIDNIPFPETSDEADHWARTVTYRALHSKILFVAVTRIEGFWSCYCVPVAGRHHEVEKHLWQLEGNKVSEAIARLLFPQYPNIPYAS